MKVLMHMCCGPCAVYPASVLEAEGIDYSGLYFNPNIHPKEEFTRRRDNVKRLSDLKGIDVDYMDDFMQNVWESHKGTVDERCNMCYSLRLDKAADYAREKGFDAYTTSLLVSPYQKHELIKGLGEKFAAKHGVDFFYRDFRPGFRQGQQMAKEMDLYRQKYCGCIISLDESTYFKKGKE